MERKKCTAVVLAAGRGSRMGIERPKQFLEVGGRPLICYALAAFEASPLVDAVVLVAGADDVGYVKEEIISKYHFTKTAAVAEGGSERFISVWNGLEAVERIADPKLVEGYVLIHDGARPFVNEEIISRTVEAVACHHACVVGMPSKDTVKIADEDGFVDSTPGRRLVWCIQTPQAFDYPLVHEAYRKLIASGRTDITDDAGVVELFTDVRVKLVEGSYRNIKVTTPEDLELIRALGNE